MSRDGLVTIGVVWCGVVAAAAAAVNVEAVGTSVLLHILIKKKSHR